MKVERKLTEIVIQTFNHDGNSEYYENLADKNRRSDISTQATCMKLKNDTSNLVVPMEIRFHKIYYFVHSKYRSFDGRNNRSILQLNKNIKKMKLTVCDLCCSMQ